MEQNEVENPSNNDEAKAEHSRWWNLLGWPKTVLILTIANGPVVGTNSAHTYVKMLYMTEELGMTKRRALFLVHGTLGLKVIGGIVAGIVADSYTGKFLVLAISYILQATTVLLYGLSLLWAKWLYIVALLLENVALFGQPLLLIFLPEQFEKAEQEKKLQTYYTYDYIYLNFSSIFWAMILIEIANEYNCLNTSKCYASIFFPYAGFVIIYATIFISMKNLYKVNLPTRTVVKDFVACMFTKTKKLPDESLSTIQNWAEKRCDHQFKQDVIQVKRLALIMSLSFLFYVVLYQTETTFMYQASFLDGSFGDKWIMKPSHAEIINPVAVIIFAPLLEHLIFPSFDKWRVLNTPLQKIGASYLLASFSFLAAGILQCFIQLKDVGSTCDFEGQLRFYNAMPTRLTISGNVKAVDDVVVHPRSSELIRVSLEKDVEIFKINISDVSGKIQWHGEVDAMKGHSVAYIFRHNNLIRVTKELIVEKSKSLRPLVVVYCADMICSGSFAFKHVKTGDKTNQQPVPANSTLTASVEMPHVGWFEFLLNHTSVDKFKFKDGGMYALLVQGAQTINVTLFTLHSPNSIHILWIFPQMITMTLAEILQYIPSSLLVFTQSPICMRSFVRVLQSSYISLAHLTIASLNQIKMEDTIWFFSLSALVLAAAFFHVILSVKYVYVGNRGE